VNDKDHITKCNLILSTTPNDEPIDRAVRCVAQKPPDRRSEITDFTEQNLKMALTEFESLCF
jgi:hypothetical protein